MNIFFYALSFLIIGKFSFIIALVSKLGFRIKHACFFHDILNMKRVKNGHAPHEFHHMFIYILMK